MGVEVERGEDRSLVDSRFMGRARLDRVREVTLRRLGWGVGITREE